MRCPRCRRWPKRDIPNDQQLLARRARSCGDAASDRGKTPCRFARDLGNAGDKATLCGRRSQRRHQQGPGRFRDFYRRRNLTLGQGGEGIRCDHSSGAPARRALLETQPGGRDGEFRHGGLGLATARQLGPAAQLPAGARARAHEGARPGRDAADVRRERPLRDRARSTPGWNRLKPGLRYALLCGDDPPVLFEQGDIGMQIERHSPWIPKENVRWSYAWIKGAAGPASHAAGRASSPTPSSRK